MKNMSNKVNILKKIKSAQWASIYQDNPDKFNYGRILACNDTDTAVILASPEGKYDGLLMIETDGIPRTLFQSKFLTAAMMMLPA